MQHYSHESQFGADPPPEPMAMASLSNAWEMAKFMVPNWAKEATTIALGVFGGLALFKMFKTRVPGPQ